MLLDTKIRQPSDSFRVTATGSSAIGIKYKGGILVCADTQISYGSTKRFPSSTRIIPITNQTVVLGSGSHADLQYLSHYLRSVVKEDDYKQNGAEKNTKEIATLICKIMYNRRCRMNPIYLDIIIAGYVGSEPFLCKVDMYGTYIEENFVTTSLGKYFALAHLRNEVNDDITYDEAKKLIFRCFHILSQLDCNSSQEIQIANIKQNMIEIYEPEFVDASNTVEQHKSLW